MELESDDWELDYWERLAVDGDVRAMMTLASLLRGSDPATASRWVERAAEGGDVDAMIQLGAGHSADDQTLARKWYETAAAAGSIEALLLLYRLLKDVEPTQAGGLLERAALFGEVRAMYEMGQLSARWHPWRARQWFERAAERGYTPAMRQLARRDNLRALLAFGSSRTRFRHAQIASLTKAAELGDIEAMWLLGCVEGWKGDFDTARGWWQRAADLGHQASEVALEEGATVWNMPRIIKAWHRDRGH